MVRTTRNRGRCSASPATVAAALAAPIPATTAERAATVQPFAAPPAQQYLQPAHGLRRPPPLRYALDRSVVNGLGTAVSILICLVALAQAGLAASYCYTYKVVKVMSRVRSRIPTAWIVPICLGPGPRGLPARAVGRGRRVHCLALAGPG